VIERKFADDFSKNWIEAFNSHDMDRIFDLYDDNFTMESPYIIERMGVTSGVLIGKDSVRPYWEKSLSSDPPLKFKLLDVLLGVSSVIILYENLGRKLVCETFTFNNAGKVISGCSQHGQSLK